MTLQSFQSIFSINSAIANKKKKREREEYRLYLRSLKQHIMKIAKMKTSEREKWKET